jgi:hypothetical protein
MAQTAGRARCKAKVGLSSVNHTQESVACNHTRWHTHIGAPAPTPTCPACYPSAKHSSRVRCSADPPPDSNEPSLSGYQLPWETEPPALPPGYAALAASIGSMDSNQLQTALGVAIAAEDYALAVR